MFIIFMFIICSHPSLQKFLVIPPLSDWAMSYLKTSLIIPKWPSPGAALTFHVYIY